MFFRSLATVLILSISLFSFDKFPQLQQKKEATFDSLVKDYAKSNIEYPGLKAVTLAMMILESGRGKSDLAKKHNNFAGLKYRTSMSKYASKVRYGDGDGDNTWHYCKFDNNKKFIKGFWAFLDRSPYKGWRKKTYSPKAFIEKIAPIYCPYNPKYAKHVLSLIPEAEALLEKHEEPLYKLASAN
ncbi:MAG: glucosaminidase domain-containing protein [Campylobacterales bacterium]|nr:glucosaminidase domain-containing protein [Campylobacterales bacterium]